MSYADIETLVSYYTHVFSNVRFDSQPQRGSETLICGDHRGSCHHYGDQEQEMRRCHAGASRRPAKTCGY